jgi:hypothetical protein
MEQEAVPMNDDIPEDDGEGILPADIGVDVGFDDDDDADVDDGDPDLDKEI